MNEVMAWRIRSDRLTVLDAPALAKSLGEAREMNLRKMGGSAMQDHLGPLAKRLGEKAGQFRIKREPYGEEPFYLYSHIGTSYRLAVGEQGDAWVYSPEADRYVRSDWQTELNRFAATLDRELQPCAEPGCSCQNAEQQAEMRTAREPWEAEIQAAREAGAEPYSRAHKEAEIENFCRAVAEHTGNPVFR